MGNLNSQTWKELWKSPKAEQVPAKVRCCNRECWMIGAVLPAMHKYIWIPGAWGIWHKMKSVFFKKTYSMFENKIVCNYRDGKVRKEELDKCATCDMQEIVCDGLSEESKSQLKHRTGKEIVDADLVCQMK